MTKIKVPFEDKNGKELIAIYEYIILNEAEKK